MLRLFLGLSLAACLWSQPIATILNEDQLLELEKKVEQHADDRASQKLLGQNYAYYIFGITSLDDRGMRVTGLDPAKASSAVAQRAREAIMTSSLAGVVGEAGQSLWHLSIDARSYQIMNRLDIKAYSEERKLAVEAVDRAVQLDPKNDQWRSYRIPMLIARINSRDALSLSPAEAYRQVKTDIAAITGFQRSFQLPYVARLAIRAEAVDDAESYAQELLHLAGTGTNFNSGDATFYGNTVLGQVALRHGDKDKAKTYLLASGKTTGSPVLHSFGPNMSLAKDLLEAGERQAVLDFFEECRSFWKMDRGKLQQWADDVTAGKIPNFGGNLLN